jgi:nucleoside-diphosphate-sugar epimerase
MDVLILGCGFAGRRVAQRLLARGVRVTATSRDPAHLADLDVTAIHIGELRDHLRDGMHVVHSVPPDGSADLVAQLGDAPSRVLYLSSTAVYGAAQFVDADTPVDEDTDRARARMNAEREIAAGAWSSLILRPAAIYGPGRGAQVSWRRGAYVGGDNYVSRIHVDDLAAHVVAGLFAEVTGAFPVADDEPCTSREIAEFCATLLGPQEAADPPRPVRATGNRRVDGSAIRRALGIGLLYPSYRVGIPASLAEA